LDTVEINPQHSATRDAVFKVIKSKTEITITQPRITRFRSNLVHRLTTPQPIEVLKVTKSKIIVTGSQITFIAYHKTSATAEPSIRIDSSELQ